MTDATHLTATITIAAGTATGQPRVLFTTGAEGGTPAQLFTVNAGTPTSARSVQAIGHRGQDPEDRVQITVIHMQFAGGLDSIVRECGRDGEHSVDWTRTHLTATITSCGREQRQGSTTSTVPTGAETAAEQIYSVNPGLNSGRQHIAQSAYAHSPV